MTRQIMLVPRTGTVARLAPDPLADLATTSIQQVIGGIGAGRISLRQARKLVEAADTVHEFADTLVCIAADGADIARISATCARDVEKLATEIDDLKTKQAKNAAARAEDAALAGAIGPVVREELDVRKLTAKLQRRQLQQQLDALDAEAARKPHPDPPPPAAQPGRFGARIPDITDATLERLTSDAAGIVREIQGGSIPTGIRQPYHAFAACLYLRARLDGEDSRTAAASARGELVAHMLDGAEFSPSQIRAFVREYQDLKKRYEAQTAQTRGASLLGSLHNLGVRAIPKNGNGAA